jgi:hypothetical protein
VGTGFAGEAVLSEVLHRRVNRVNDSEHKGTLSDSGAVKLRCFMQGGRGMPSLVRWAKQSISTAIVPKCTRPA